jgi:hypothetical protein
LGTILSLGAKLRGYMSSRARFKDSSKEASCLLFQEAFLAQPASNLHILQRMCWAGRFYSILFLESTAHHPRGKFSLHPQSVSSL